MRFHLRHIAAACACAAILTPDAFAAGSTHSWAQPQIKAVTRAHIFAGTAATFRAADPLTEGTLARAIAKLTNTAARHPQNGGAPVSMEQLDHSLVTALGLRDAAYRFYLGARQAGLHPPKRFGTQVVARLLGLRYTYPRDQQQLELDPLQTATRAEAAYSVAQILHFGSSDHGWWHHRHDSSATTSIDLAASWQVEMVKSAAAAFELPQLTRWQKRIIGTAFSYIGYPYVWGGTGQGTPGFDCSGFVWRVYKLTSYPGEGDLASVLRGRTTMEMSGEVPPKLRIHADKLQPGDVLYFGHGPRSKPAQVDHAAIYLGNNWLVESSGQGVAIAPFDGWKRAEFAWARRPLAEAHLR